jgi:hypothetical protein
MALMKSWIDTVARHDNIWLVLVFHGVDGVGWEPRSGAELKEYFEYIRARQGDLWVATFQDVTKYLRERAHAKLTTTRSGESIRVTLTHDLADARYDLPLTLRTLVPSNWPGADVRQGDRVKRVASVRNGSAVSVLYQASPNAGPVTLTQAAS